MIRSIAASIVRYSAEFLCNLTSLSSSEFFSQPSKKGRTPLLQTMYQLQIGFELLVSFLPKVSTRTYPRSLSQKTRNLQALSHSLSKFQRSLEKCSTQFNLSLVEGKTIENKEEKMFTASNKEKVSEEETQSTSTFRSSMTFAHFANRNCQENQLSYSSFP